MKKHSWLWWLLPVILLLTIMGWVYFDKKNNEPLKTSASNNSTALSSKTTWNMGTKNNIDVDTGNDLQIDNKSQSEKYDLSGATLTASKSPENVGLAIDGDKTTYWGPVQICPNQDYPTYYANALSIDLPSPITVGVLKALWQGESMRVEYKDDGGTWHNITMGPFTPFIDGLAVLSLGSQVTSAHWRVITINIGCEYQPDVHTPPPHEVWVKTKEIQFFPGGAVATHTSAATQIDGSEGGAKNFITWQTFTPTYTKPANTNVQFRFRTSPDHATWTSWTAYQTPGSGGAFDISSLVDSASGANKYLQVETTLSNTDGASTPTVDSYSVGYHTNIKPDKPVAQTAVIGP